MIQANKKAFILHDECSASVSLKIIYFEYLQQGSCETLNPGIFLQKYLQPNALQAATMMALWKVMFCSPHPSNIYGERDFVSPILQNKLEKYTFLWFKKRHLFLKGRKYKWILPKKYVKFFSSGNYFTLDISPLITSEEKGNWKIFSKNNQINLNLSRNQTN